MSVYNVPLSIITDDGYYLLAECLIWLETANRVITASAYLRVISKQAAANDHVSPKSLNKVIKLCFLYCIHSQVQYSSRFFLWFLRKLQTLKYQKYLCQRLVDRWDVEKASLTSWELSIIIVVSNYQHCIIMIWSAAVQSLVLTEDRGQKRVADIFPCAVPTTLTSHMSQIWQETRQSDNSPSGRQKKY